MKLVVLNHGNEKFRFPQELEDTIFLYSDFVTLEETRTLQSTYVKKCTEYKLLETAVKKNNLHCVRYLLSKELDCWLNMDNTATWAMDYAAANGHLEVVTWFHENRKEGCTTAAMDYAAANGKLEIVKFLHFNRTEGCTTIAMDSAAVNGHLEVVKWLHENRTEGCTTIAMDYALLNGHLEIVIWLHENRAVHLMQ